MAIGESRCIVVRGHCIHQSLAIRDCVRGLQLTKDMWRTFIGQKATIVSETPSETRSNKKKLRILRLEIQPAGTMIRNLSDSTALKKV